MILFVDEDPKKVTYMFDDKRIASNIYFLSMAISESLFIRMSVGPWPPNRDNSSYKYIIDWICKSRSNYHWAVKCLDAFLDDYNDRFGRIHKAKNFISFFTDPNNFRCFPDRPLTEFPEPPEVPDVELEDSYKSMAEKHKDIYYKLINNSVCPEYWWGYGCAK